jgi:hypothetical protein
MARQKAVNRGLGITQFDPKKALVTSVKPVPTKALTLVHSQRRVLQISVIAKLQNCPISCITQFSGNGTTTTPLNFTPIP